MAKRKRRKLKKWVLPLGAFLLCSLILLLVLLVNTITSPKSINADAKRYKNGNCTIFYPKGTNNKEFVKNICKSCEGEEKIIYDYQKELHGDYYLISYGEFGSFYMDLFKKDLVYTDIGDDLTKVSDYLRYEVKKNHSELYNAEFLDRTYVSNLNKEDFDFKIKNEYLNCIYKVDNIEFNIPLKYLEDELNINLGNDELYSKPKYIDPNKPVIAFTFDDGPQASTGQRIIDTLYKYDGVGTFFLIGNRLSDKQIDYIKDGIKKGNQYGSHSNDHQKLTELELDEATKAIKDTVDYLYNKTGYKMSVYRSPYGAHRDDVSEALKMKDILWNLDSLDWDSLNSDAVFNTVTKNIDGNDVILFHEIHESTVKAIEKLVPYLVDQGYQLVTVNELMEYLNVDMNSYRTFIGS